MYLYNKYIIYDFKYLHGRVRFEIHYNSKFLINRYNEVQYS